jgi:hypothetical protein
MENEPSATGVPPKDGNSYSIYGTGRKAVYALIDPREPETVRYVGLTVDPEQRLRQHIEVAKGSTWGAKTRIVAMGDWIVGLLAAGVLPELRILEVVDEADLDDGMRELHWIRAYDSEQLFNRKR